MVSQFMSVLAIVAAIFNSGIIQGIVQAIEGIYKEYNGAQKKEVALKMLTPLVPAIGAPLLSDAIDAQVATFNEAGVFKHATLGIVDPGVILVAEPVIKGHPH